MGLSGADADAAKDIAHAARQAAAHHRKRNSAFIGYAEKPGPYHNIMLNTVYGPIKIAPRTDLSPITVALVTALAARPSSTEGQAFIRHEPVPPSWAENGFYGPPYALLGGTLRSMQQEPPAEGRPPIERGDVAMIPGSMDFFIALAAHPEWGSSHTVWGKVNDAESWDTIGKIPKAPYSTLTDSSGITTRWLNSTVPFTVGLKPQLQRQLAMRRRPGGGGPAGED